MSLAVLAISGAGGLIGSALTASLQGQRVIRLSRAPSGDGVAWDPARGRFDASGLEGCDAVIHLAGAPIAGGRWSPKVKAEIRASRVEGTRLLVDGLAKLTRRPGLLICASAIGFYGDRGEEELTERSPAGQGYLAEVCRAWEEEAARASAAGIRVVMLRTGIVLSPKGGALAKMLPPFRLGAGGRLGSGRQWMSWIHIEDMVGIIRFVLERPDLSGPINVVAPHPARNADFTRALARVLHRPAIFPAPAFMLKLAIGEMAEALLLSSQRVTPAALQQKGYHFRHPGLEPALGQLLA